MTTVFGTKLSFVVAERSDSVFPSICYVSFVRQLESKVGLNMTHPDALLPSLAIYIDKYDTPISVLIFAWLTYHNWNCTKLHDTHLHRQDFYCLILDRTRHTDISSLFQKGKVSLHKIIKFTSCIQNRMKS